MNATGSSLQLAIGAAVGAACFVGPCAAHPVTYPGNLMAMIEADRVVLLEHGRVAAAGTHSELLAAEPRYVDIVSHLEDPVDVAPRDDSTRVGEDRLAERPEHVAEQAIASLDHPGHRRPA